MSKQNALLEVATELAVFLEEAHQTEMAARHHGDVRRSGPAPRSCSYCAAIKRAVQVINRYERNQP